MRRCSKQILGSISTAFVGVALVVAPPARAAAAPSWTVQRVVAPSGVSVSALQAVSCPAPSSCVGVGEVDSMPGVVRIEDGVVASAISLSLPSDAEATGRFTVADVSCWGINECVAVGTYLTDGHGLSPLILTAQPDGSWILEKGPLPDGSFLSALEHVACNAQGCVATGSTGSWGEPPLLITRGTDGTWSAPSISLPFGVQHTDMDLPSCPPSGACVAVGHVGFDIGGSTSEVFAFPAGESWKTVYFPHPDDGSVLTLHVQAMDCAAASECTAIGWYGGDPGPRMLREVLHLGHLHAAPLAAPRGYAVGGDDAGISCWRATECAAYVHGSTGTLMYRRDGLSWTYRAGAVSNNRFADISCSAARTCAAVGQSGAGWPVAATLSGNGGWLSQSTDPATLIRRADEGRFATVSCVVHQCVALGSAYPSRNPNGGRAIVGVARGLPSAG